MTQNQAIDILDPSGMLRAAGVAGSTLELPEAAKLRWAVIGDDGRPAFLPPVIADSVERLVCQHRKDRKMMVQKTPDGWKDKLLQVNQRKMQIVYNRRSHRVMNPKEVQKAGKHLEKLVVDFSLLEEEEGKLSGKGRYYIEGDNYARKDSPPMNIVYD